MSSNPFDFIVSVARLNTWKEHCKTHNEDIESAQTNLDYLVAQDETLESIIADARQVLKRLGSDLSIYGIQED